MSETRAQQPTQHTVLEESSSPLWALVFSFAQWGPESCLAPSQGCGDKDREQDVDPLWKLETNPDLGMPFPLALFEGSPDCSPSSISLSSSDLCLTLHGGHLAWFKVCAKGQAALSPGPSLLGAHVHRSLAPWPSPRQGSRAQLYPKCTIASSPSLPECCSLQSPPPL